MNNNMETKATSDVDDSQYERIDNVWGWGEFQLCYFTWNTSVNIHRFSQFVDDADLDPEERQDVKILNPKYEKTL